MTQPFALYRYFDENGRLLYIGISGELGARVSGHVAKSRWMQLAAGSTIERHGTLAEVKAVEVAAIKAEHPLFNLQHNDTPEARERLRLYLDEIGRPDLLPNSLRQARRVRTERETAPDIHPDCTCGRRVEGPDTGAILPILCTIHEPQIRRAPACMTAGW